MQNLTKREIITQIFKETGLPQKDIQEVVQSTLDIVAEALINGRHVELRNFGVFEVQVRKKRIGRNPNRPQADVVIPERPVVKFKTGKTLRERMEEQPLSVYQKSP